MNNNGEYATTTLFRRFDTGVSEELDSFEQELCDLLSAGYSVVGYSMNENMVSALLIKTLVITKSTEGKQP